MIILLVDDMPDTRDIFSIAFGMYGHQTRTAGNGLEAIEAVRREVFDAIVMDVEMPELNGWDAVQRIRDLDNGRHVPILMFTAYGSPEDHHRALHVGADCLLEKPVLPQDVLAKITELTKRQRATDLSTPTP